MELRLEGEQTLQHQMYTQRLAEVLMNLVLNVYDPPSLCYQTPS